MSTELDFSEPRLDYYKLAPDAAEGIMQLERYIHSCGLEESLIDLVKLRASQINGCAYCVDMHTKEARSRGESEQRLYGVVTWHEAPFYTARERAALAWTEAVTLVAVNHVPDDIYDAVHEQFSDKEMVDLTFAVIAINSWNRLAVSFRTMPGTFQPNHPVTQKKSPVAAQ